MTVRGPRAFQVISGEVVLDAVMDLEELMGNPAWKEPRNSVASLEKAADYLDPRRSRVSDDPGETMFFSHVILSVTGEEPRVVGEVTTFLRNMWADVLNVVVFRVRPPNYELMRKFLLEWHSQLQAERMREVEDWQRVRHPGAKFLA